MDVGDVRILGCTLWTDFGLPGFTQREWMNDVANISADYRLIRTSSGRLRVSETLEDHERSRRWMESELATPFEGKTVVVSHMGPHPKSIHRRFTHSNTNAAFVSDLTPLFSDVDRWVHGHVHDSFDYDVDACRIVTNPAGYVLNKPSIKESTTGLLFENPAFDAKLVLDLPEENGHSKSWRS